MIGAGVRAAGATINQWDNIKEWTIGNDSDDLHIFHILQIGFQVVEVNGQPVPFTGYISIT
jgi:FtsP/CotA-like multicopper oxidase with cupredoxin domain